MWLLVRIVALCVFVGLIECATDVHRIFVPCFRRDIVCQTVSAQQTFQNIVRGVPSLGIESSDPLYQKEISGTFNGLIYNWTEVTTTGVRTCIVNFFRLDVVSLANLRMNLTCTTGTIKGKYNINGDLFGRKVNESSSFTARARNPIFLGADLKLKQVQGDDGKKHLLIDDVKTYATTLGPIVVKLENSDDLERFVNAHQRETAQLIAGTFVDSNLKVIAARANIFLKSVAVDDLFLNIGIPPNPWLPR